MSAAIPAGYKQTEVGVIPRDWDVTSLGKLSEFITSGSRGWARFYSDRGALFVRSQNVRDGQLNFSEKQFVNPPEGSEGDRTRLSRSDLLITITGNNVGNVALVEQDLGEAYISQHVGLVRFLKPEYGAYVCRFLAPGSIGNEQILVSQSGQSKPGLSLKNLQEFLVAFPPLPEQRAIAAALSDVDTLLAKLDQLIAKKRNLKQAAMQQLLTGQTRLPGFSGQWEVKRLKDIFTISAGKSKSSYVANGGQYWIVDMGSVSIDGKLIVSKATNFCGDFLRAGDLVMPKDDIGGGGIIGKVGYIDVDKVYVLGDHVYRLTANCGNPIFLSYAINGHVTNSALRKKVIGSAQLGLGRKSVEDQEMLFPGKEEQTAIATLLADMDTELAAMEARAAKTRALKQGMMQELLTGRIRLVDAHAASIKQPKGKSAEPQVTAPGPAHNWAFNEAVVIAILVDKFGTHQYPLGRMRYTKLSYLMHRKAENDAQGYLKKKAGPYNPQTRYAGPEKIAQQSGYMRDHTNGKYKGWIASDKIGQARTYFDSWYGTEMSGWLEQFRYKPKDELELLATVDMAMKELTEQNKPVDVNTVRAKIASYPEWAPKLTRDVFSNEGIAAAMAQCRTLFPS